MTTHADIVTMSASTLSRHLGELPRQLADLSLQALARGWPAVLADCQELTIRWMQANPDSVYAVVAAVAGAQASALIMPNTEPRP